MAIPCTFRIGVKSTGDDCGQIASARVTFDVNVSVAHPRFKQIAEVMHSKKVRGEYDAYRYNASLYYSLVDELVDNAFMEIIDNIHKKLAPLGWVAGMMIACMTASALLQFWLGLGLAAAVLLLVSLAAYRLMARLREVNEFFFSWLAGYQDRIDKSCREAGFSVKEGGEQYDK